MSVLICTCAKVGSTQYSSAAFGKIFHKWEFTGVVSRECGRRKNAGAKPWADRKKTTRFVPAVHQFVTRIAKLNLNHRPRRPRALSHISTLATIQK